MNITRRTYIILAICLMTFALTHAQIRKPLPTIGENDMVRVYAAQSMEALESNCLKDLPRLTLSKDERMEIGALLGHNYNKARQRFYPSFSEGLFVEVRPQEGEPFGYYMTPKGYTPIVLDEMNITYSYPKKKKEMARELITKYQQRLPMTCELVNYDHLPMKSSLHRPIACLLCPGSWNWMRAYFFVQMDSSLVKPISYSIRTKKKKDALIVSRSMPLLWFYDKGILNRESPPDSIANEQISKLIPEWNSLDDQGRMRLLDNAIREAAHK